MMSTIRTRCLRTILLRHEVLLCVVFCAWVMGCKVYPEPNRKSIDELYFEALDANRRTPEHSLGLNPSRANQPASLIDLMTPATSTEGLPEDVPPVPAAEELREPASAPSPLPGPVPMTIPAIEDVASPSDSTTLPDAAQPLRLQPSTGASWRRARKGTIRPVSHSSEPTRVTENFEETDIRQALQVLASQAGVTVIVDEQISGAVTALIEDEPFETALRKVLLPMGLVHVKTAEGEYIIAVPDPSSPLFSRVSTRLEFRPLHVSPEDLMKMIPQREARFITVVDKRNIMMIEAPEELAQTLLERLKQADHPIPQVELEAIVCVIAPDKGFKSGLDWNHAVTLNGSEVLKFGMAGLNVNGSGSRQGANSAFSDFAVTAAFVKLLAQEGYLSIRAAPRVTARDGEQAKIAITRQSFFSTQPVGTSQFFNSQIEEVEAGITLEITPIIRGENITVKIEKAEVSEDIRTTDVSATVQNNPYPLINRRTVSTTVSVRDSETIVIGGLVQRQTVDRIAKIPVLGDIPYAGRMFQTVEQLEQDAEVVIFISPRLVESSPGCPPAAPVSHIDTLTETTAQ